MSNLEDFYLKQYNTNQVNQIEKEKRIVQKTNDLVDSVPKIIKRMIQEAEISHPDCVMINIDGKLRPSWIILYHSDDRGSESVNLLLDGHLVNVHQNPPEPGAFDSYTILRHITQVKDDALKSYVYCEHFRDLYDSIIDKASKFGVPLNESIEWRRPMNELNALWSR
ncbi:MAG TPA: hypothetical protein VFD55_00240 [Candidatus Angelobacter sp.]|nr:hypothetical protein [Candidatus Angelobacter sp.]